MTVRRTPRTCTYICCHIQSSALVMVSHIVHYISYAYRFLRLYPQRKFITDLHLSVNERKITVYNRLVIVMTEETPNSCLAVSYGSEIHWSVSLAEREIFVLSVKVSHFSCKGDNIRRVHTLVFHNIESKFLVYLLGLREFTYAAGVGVSGNAVIRNTPCYPNCTLSSFTLSNEFHNPRLILITHCKGLSCIIITVLLNQLMHNCNCLSCGCRSLKCNLHKGKVSQPTLFVPQFLTSAPGSFNNRYLMVIHKAHNSIRVRNLWNKHIILLWREPVSYVNHLPCSMHSGRRIG